MQRPNSSEHDQYFGKYIDLVNEAPMAELLRQNTDYCTAFFSAIPTEKHNYRYAANKWTIKEVLMHLIDTERVMAYRAFVAARADAQSILNSMNENLYAENATVNERTMESLISEFIAVRNATVVLLLNITDEQSELTCNVNGKIATARACAYIILGHPLHHINVINERYL